MKRLSAALLLLLCLAAPFSGFARETPKPDAGDMTLDPVVVTAGRIEESARSVTQSVTVVPREEIKKNQYQDLGSLLRNYGVQIDSFTPNGSLSSISIRGIRSSALGNDLQGAVLLLVDGRRTGTDNVSMIPLVNVERVEILRGPASVQYGTSAIGGVVNVITRRGNKNLAASAEAGGGSWDTGSGQGSFAWATGPLDYSGGVSYLSMNDYKLPSGKKYDNTGLDHKTTFSANLGYNFLEEHRIGVVMQGVDSYKMGSPGYIDDVHETEYNNRSNYSADVTYDGGYKDAGLNWKARYFNGKTDYKSDDPKDMWGYAYYKNKTDYQGAQGQVSFTRGILTLTGGVDWLHYNTKSYADYYTNNEHSIYDNTGTFLLAKLGFFDNKVILSGGLRYDYYTLENSDKDSDFDRTTPSVGLAWHALDWLTLKANYGESYRIPDTQAMLGFYNGFTNFIGNSNLKPEKGQGWDAGFVIEHKALKLGLSYFQTDYKDKITTRVLDSSSVQYYNMSGTTKYRGLEGEASYDVGEALKWPVKLRPYVNFTRMLQREDQNGHTVPNVSDWDLAYGLNFGYPEIGLNVDLRATYYGKQKVQDWNYNSSSYGQNVDIGEKTVVDLFATQTLYKWDGVGTLSLKGEIRNLFNESYETIKDYPQPGRSYWVGLRYDY